MLIKNCIYALESCCRAASHKRHLGDEVLDLGKDQNDKTHMQQGFGSAYVQKVVFAMLATLPPFKKLCTRSERAVHQKPVTVIGRRDPEGHRPRVLIV